MSKTQQVVALSKCYATDEELLRSVLKPYKGNCRYLQQAEIVAEGDPKERGRVIGQCKFSIPESCYIDDTGHFNSVEFNICYNQMAYYVMAKSVKEELMFSFASWTMDDYWAKQLPDIYIVRLESTFRKSIQPGYFLGEIMFTDVRMRSGMMYLTTQCKYWDEGGGNCDGTVKLAIANPL